MFQLYDDDLDPSNRDPPVEKKTSPTTTIRNSFQTINSGSRIIGNSSGNLPPNRQSTGGLATKIGSPIKYEGNHSQVAVVSEPGNFKSVQFLNSNLGEHFGDPSQFNEPDAPKKSINNKVRGTLGMAPKHEQFDDDRRSKVHIFKKTVSVVGVVDCLAMLAMAVFIILEIDDTNFFTICYSISQAMLFLVAGMFVFVVEAKVFFPKKGKGRLSNFVMNKLGLVIFYFWIGALIMGGKNYKEDSQRTMGRVAGIVSWLLSGCNLITACAIDKEREMAPKFGMDFKGELVEADSIDDKFSNNNEKPLEDQSIGNGLNPFEQSRV